MRLECRLRLAFSGAVGVAVCFILTWAVWRLYFQVAHGRAASGVVHITSTPPGATIFVDNRFAGVTPQVVRNLAPGAHLIKLEKKGCPRFVRTVTVGSEAVRLDAPLEPERSSEIRIASLPSDAAVFLNGQYRGHTPLSLSGLAAGEYEVRLTMDNCDPWLRTVQLKTGQRLTLQAELTSPQEKFLRDAIAQKPNDATNYTDLARHYIVRKKYDQAVAVYKMAFDRRDKSMESRLYRELGRAYAGQYKSAEDAADLKALRAKFVRLFADSGNALMFFTAVQQAGVQTLPLDPEAQKAQLAQIQELEQRLIDRPDDVLTRLELGKLYLDWRDMKHAQEQFKRVAQLTEHNWMTLAELRQEEAMRARGMVKVDGRWVSVKEAERMALARLPAAEKARQAAQEQAKRLAFEKIRLEAEEQARRQAAEKDRREAEERTRRELAEKAKREAEERARKAMTEKARREAQELARRQAAEKAKGLAFAPKAFTEAEPEWPLDSFQAGVGWQPEPWADPAMLKVVPLNSGKALNIKYPGGKNSKACVSRQIPAPADLSSRGQLVLDVINNSKTLAAISVLITADQDYESLPQFVRPGGHQQLVFPIKGDQFKCPRDHWQKHAFSIARPNNVTRIGLMLNTPVDLVVKNIKLVK